MARPNLLIHYSRRRMFLFPLMDVFLILLLFYVALAIRQPDSGGVDGVLVPTPSFERGRAQILVQLIDTNSYLWFDATTGAKNSQLSRQASEQLSHLDSRIAEYSGVLKACAGDDIYVVIRAPRSLSVSAVMAARDIVATKLDSLLVDRRVHVAMLSGSPAEVSVRGMVNDPESGTLIEFTP